MCTNQREIKNLYTGHTLYVKCGKCPACLQEKAAHRVSRIRAQDSPNLTTLMVTLTYRRNDSPYVLRDDAYKFSRGEIKTLSVYRDTVYRKVRQNAQYDIGYSMHKGLHKLCDVKFLKSTSFSGNKDLAHQHSKIGVAFYPDVQHFAARLRLNLKRNFNYEYPITLFSVSEYGSKSLRPHFHLLLWCRKGDKEILRSAVAQSWPFSDISNWPRAFEEAFRASSYCASYVNCSSDFPEFLKAYFRPKHSYSKGFGCNYGEFQLPKILTRLRQGCLSFYRQVDKQGIPSIVELPFPKYVIHRYFPKFKGYSRLAPTSLSEHMQRFADLYRGDFSQFLRLSKQLDNVFPVYYSELDKYRISVRLNNAFVRFRSECGMSDALTFSEYCNLHQQIWTCYNSTVLRLHLCNPDVPLEEKYDNLEVYRIRCEEFGSPPPLGFTHQMLSVTNPNEFKSVQFRTLQFSNSYHEHIKHRNVNNVVLSSVNEEF